ncbi:MAG: YbaB/EbfC family nucleoid-associated protein [Coriobacteriales bacterium]|jgi:DNA-binding YbaB/EbfC family protein|nr:YbaB/EbfC family nucleoid-associated protein [Coriobacteriales bacterium]
MDMKKMMKEARKMQAELSRAQEEVAELEAEGSAGGGVVRATASGAGVLLSVTIDPEVVDPEDVPMLQDLVLTAVNEALGAAAEVASARMNAVTGNMNLPF